jgi:hypothetical protein
MENPVRQSRMEATVNPTGNETRTASPAREDHHGLISLMVAQANPHGLISLMVAQMGIRDLRDLPPKNLLF